MTVRYGIGEISIREASSVRGIRTRGSSSASAVRDKSGDAVSLAVRVLCGENLLVTEEALDATILCCNFCVPQY